MNQEERMYSSLDSNNSRLFEMDVVGTLVNEERNMNLWREHNWVLWLWHPPIRMRVGDYILYLVSYGVSCHFGNFFYDIFHE